MEGSYKEKREEFEMLEALYDFKATIPQTLSFSRDEEFIFHSGNNITKNWWSVINIKGKMGYIPSNYVTIIKVKKEKLIDFLNHSIEHLGKEIAREGGGNDKHLELMQEIISRRQDLMEKKHKSKSLHREKISSSKSLPNSTIEVEKGSPSPPLRQTVSESKFHLDPCNSNAVTSNDSCDSSNLNPHAAYALVQQVRSESGLSYEGARLAVGVVIEGLVETVPGASGGLKEFLRLLHDPSPPPHHVLDETPDACSLRSSLTHLTACRDDAQQRSWQLWDDEATIKHHILKISSILSNADPAISNRVVHSNDYADITMLVEYYQMEERWSIRQLLLQTFSVLCSLDKTIVSILLNSVLPMELAREMQSNIKITSRLLKPAVLLSMIFSAGEPMPITHLEYLGVDFIKLSFDLIERERESDIADSVITFILSYNLQFKPNSSTNIIVQALGEMECAKTFTEKVLLLINREDDPLVYLKTPSNATHSVLKLLKDLFSSPLTAKLFYTNDTRVLMDIIVRQITDLQANNPKRTSYLELCKLVVQNCEAASFEHRLEELRFRFTFMLMEESPPVPQDKSIVFEIINILPEYFGEFVPSPET